MNSISTHSAVQSRDIQKKFLNRFVPGRAGTEEFVPGHLLLPLSRDNGTPGQEFFFVPGQRDNGTSRFVPGRPKANKSSVYIVEDPI